MQDLLAVVQISAFFILWLLAGYYLSRSRFDPIAIATSGVLISFALIQADQFLGAAFDSAWVGRVLWFAYPLPAALWLRVMILIKPGDNLALDRAWWTLLLPVTMLIILGGWVGDDLVDFATREPNDLYGFFVLYNLAVMVPVFWLNQTELNRLSKQDRAYVAFFWLRIAVLGYSGSMLILATGLLSPAAAFGIVVIDVVILGSAAIAYDAIAEGQNVRRDLGFVILKTLLLLSLLVVPWGVAVERWSLGMGLALFFTLVVVALASTLIDDVENVIDRVLFRHGSDEQQARTALRTLMQNTARHPENALRATEIDRDEFVRLTRRALSHMPNLPRLAASPLTNMNLVSQRLEESPNTLERAGELRRVLAECIETLRPSDQEEYGLTDDWRFYNALYYPYVVGVSPYKHSLIRDELGQSTQKVIEWFQMAVPQRTLYNWQNRGAEMIAEILLEQEQQIKI